MVLAQPFDYEAVIRRLSVERIAPYVSGANGDSGQAIALHAWNTRLSAVFYEVLQAVELALRNTMHEQLSVWNRRQGGDGRWYLTLTRQAAGQSASVLSARGIQDIGMARRRATLNGKPEAPGRVVAELNFGFWRFLLSRRYEHTLWTPALRHGFDNGRLGRPVVDREITHLHHLRNRVAHHEPIFRRDLVRDHNRAVQVIQWMCPDTAEWVQSLSRFQDVHTARP